MLISLLYSGREDKVDDEEGLGLGLGNSQYQDSTPRSRPRPRQTTRPKPKHKNLPQNRLETRPVSGLSVNVTKVGPLGRPQLFLL